MIITFTALIWLPILVWAAIKKNISTLASVTVASFIFQAASMFIIGSYSIDVMLFCCLLFITIYIIRYKRIRKPRKETKWLFLLMIVSVLSLVIALLFFRNNQVISFVNVYLGVVNLTNLRIGTENLTKLIIFLVYGSTYILFEKIYIDEKSTRRLFDILVILVLIFGIWQWLETKEILPPTILRQLLYSNDVHYNSIAYGKNVAAYNSRIFSTFSEPSYCGVFLSASFWYYFSNKKSRYRLCLMLLCLIELIINLTASGMVGFFSGGLYIVISSKEFSNKKKITILLSFILIFGILFATGFVNYLLTFIVDKMASYSYFERITLTEYALKAFKDTYFLGAGYGSIRGSDLIHNILGQIGVLGLICYLFFWIGLYKRANKLPGLGAYLIAVLGAQIVANGDLTLTSFWIGAYIVNLSSKERGINVGL